MSLTTDPKDPRLGEPERPGHQNEVYLVLSEEERAAGFKRPVRQTYLHKVCGTTTTMGLAIAETCARNPEFYTHTYCMKCGRHLPVGEFVWDGAEQEAVGS